MAAQDKDLMPLPGLDIVGRGVYLKPRQPYQLKGLLFKQEKPQKYHSVESNKTYSIPTDYGINESPPMPANKSLNQVMIEESFERFETQTSLDASLAVSNSFFSIDASASQSKNMRSNDESYYAMRSSVIPLWTIYLPSPARFSMPQIETEVPEPFSKDKRRKYDKFFSEHGTHYVRRVWVGGKANLSFTIAKSSNMSKSDIQAGIKASFGGVGGASLNTSQQKSKELLQSNSECTVNGKGGDELKLASLSTLDEVNYNQWLETIGGNPQVIELEVEGIWNLFEDEKKARALQDAYIACTTFVPVSAVFRVNENVYFLRGKRFTRYNLEEGKCDESKQIESEWPNLFESEIKEVDAVLQGNGLVSHEGKNLDSKFFLFDEKQFVRFDLNTKKVDPGYPKPISVGWPGMPFERIDAVLNAGQDSVYFFTGNQYVRFNMADNRVEDGYPQSISKRWVGVTFDRIDAVTYWGDGKVYFFRKDQHIRYDMANYCADPGYPKEIIGSYAQDWKFFY